MRSIPPFKLEIKFDTGQEFLSRQFPIWIENGRLYSSDLESYKRELETGQWTKLYKPNTRIRGFSGVTLGEEHGVTWGSLGHTISSTVTATPTTRAGAVNFISEEWTRDQWAGNWSGELQVTDVDRNRGRVTVNHVSNTANELRGLTSSAAIREMERLESLREQQAAMNRHIAEHATHHRAELDRREAQRLAEQQRLEAERNRPSFLRRINPFR